MYIAGKSTNIILDNFGVDNMVKYPIIELSIMVQQLTANRKILFLHILLFFVGLTVSHFCFKYTYEYVHLQFNCQITDRYR